MTSRENPSRYDSLYDLTALELERLVAGVFAQAGYSNVKLVGGPTDPGFDIVATKDGERVAIQVKHKKHVTLHEIRQYVHEYFSNPSAPPVLVFVTSADLPQDVASVSAQLPVGARLEILGRQDLQQMLSKHAALSGRFLDLATRRFKSQRQRLILSTIGAIASVLAGLISIYPTRHFHQAPLDTRIQTVESALSSIRDLEAYLGEIKKDMVDTQEATRIINRKYAQAKELEKLTDVQLAALKTTLQTQSWQSVVFNYAMGCVLGIASSFVASVLYARWRQRKSLE
jgi:hypothetical protein